MADELQGKKIAFVVLPEQAEDVELAEPWDSVKNAGGTPELLSTQSLEISLDQGDRRVTARLVSEAGAADYDGLVLPGDVIPSRRLIHPTTLLDPPEWLEEWLESNNDAVVFVDTLTIDLHKPVWTPVTVAEYPSPPGDVGSGKKWTHRGFGEFARDVKRK